MTALRPHYMEAHADVVQNKSGTPEEMKKEVEDWMLENKARFEAAE